VSIKEQHISVFLKLYIFGRKVKAMMKKHNRDQVQRSIILETIKEEPVPIGVIGDMLGIKASTMTEKIKSMKSEGLVVSIKGQDAREKLLKLTRKGLKRTEMIEKQMQEEMCRVEMNLSDDELKQLNRILDKINWEAK